MSDFPLKYLICLLIPLSFLAFSCQQPASDIIDPALETKIEEAWQEVNQYLQQKEQGKAREIDDPRQNLSNEFYQDYLKHRRTKTGEVALNTAFRMWASIGETQKIEPDVWQLNQGSFSNFLPLIVHVLVMIIAGIFGGLINYFLEEENSESDADTKHRKKQRGQFNH